MPRLVVPLDESGLAEEALPWAALIARAARYSVHLVSVWTADEIMWVRAGVDPGDSIEKIRDSIHGYLERTAASAVLAGLDVTTEVRLGEPAEQIAEAAAEGETAMVVITSHGRGGIKRLIQGSVADKLARTLSVPLLVERAGGIEPALTRIVVTLDGSETSAAALPVARGLARAVGAELHLLRAYNPLSEVHMSPLAPVTDLGRLSEQMYEAAETYMKEIAEPGEKWDVQAGRPLDVILQYARDHDCQVIAMATHGRGGIVRLALGSTSDAVVRAADRPVLLVPVREE
jgi:nucleotide-binding universal stress UspA family protein